MATAPCIPSISSPRPNKLSPSNSIKFLPSPSHRPRSAASLSSFQFPQQETLWEEPREINPEKVREEFRDVSKSNGGTGVKDFMDGMGLGYLVEQLGELKLGELLDMPPPGIDEVAIAISKGHTLQILSLPDILDALIGKILKLKQKISSATSAIKSVSGQEENTQDAADKLERLRERMVKV